MLSVLLAASSDELRAMAMQAVDDPDSPLMIIFFAGVCVLYIVLKMIEKHKTKDE